MDSPIYWPNRWHQTSDSPGDAAVQLQFCKRIMCIVYSYTHHRPVLTCNSPKTCFIDYIEFLFSPVWITLALKSMFKLIIEKLYCGKLPGGSKFLTTLMQLVGWGWAWFLHVSVTMESGLKLHRYKLAEFWFCLILSPHQEAQFSFLGGLGFFKGFMPARALYFLQGLSTPHSCR